MFALSPDVFDLSLSDCCLQENENTTENGINPELAKVGYTDSSGLCCCIIVLYCMSHCCLWLTWWYLNIHSMYEQHTCECLFKDTFLLTAGGGMDQCFLEWIHSFLYLVVLSCYTSNEEARFCTNMLMMHYTFLSVLGIDFWSRRHTEHFG